MVSLGEKLLPCTAEKMWPPRESSTNHSGFQFPGQGVPEPGAAQMASGTTALWDQANDLLSLVVGLGDGERLGSIRDSHQQGENVGP